MQPRSSGPAARGSTSRQAARTGPGTVEFSYTGCDAAHHTRDRTPAATRCGRRGALGVGPATLTSPGTALRRGNGDLRASRAPSRRPDRGSVRLLVRGKLATPARHGALSLPRTAVAAGSRPLPRRPLSRSSLRPVSRRPFAPAFCSRVVSATFGDRANPSEGTNSGSAAPPRSCLRDRRYSSPASGRHKPRLPALAREWAPMVDARWTSTGRFAPGRVRSRSATPKRAIDDLTTDWIAAKRLPSGAEIAFSCGTHSSAWIRTRDLTIMSRAL